MVFGKKKKLKQETKRIEYEPSNEDDESIEEEYEESNEEVEEEREEMEEPKQMKPISTPKLPDTWTVRDVPIQSEKVLFNQKTNKAIDLHTAIAKILNLLEGI